MELNEERKYEHGKYDRAYSSNANYAMGLQRKMDATLDLASLPMRGYYLDGGCGRGEMLEIASGMGFEMCRGVDIVQALLDPPRIVYGEVHQLPFPDKHFDVVTMLDVIEHLIVGDDELACRELKRVARHHIILTANNRPSKSLGEELHINKRPYEEWDRLFKEWFAPATVTWIKTAQKRYVSEGWRIDL